MRPGGTIESLRAGAYIPCEFTAMASDTHPAALTRWSAPFLYTASPEPLMHQLENLMSTTWQMYLIDNAAKGSTPCGP